LIYKTEEEKSKAVIEEVKALDKANRPVLIGTISIEKSELLGKHLARAGVKHHVLNAKNHEREAEIVAEAGRLGAVTIATNMAGRGTDIILGGNPEFEAKKEMRKVGYEEEVISFASSFVPSQNPEWIKARSEYERLLKSFAEERKEEQAKVRSLGGLHIIGTERHEARRIDNQLRGRSGRQGDPGSTQFFITLDDDLMRLFGGEKIQNVISKLGVAEDEAIEAGLLTKSIENAQKKVEGRNYGIRKYVLQYDDVMNKQRSIIYSERNKVLFGEDLREHILSMMKEIAREMADYCSAQSKYAEEWDFEDLNKKIKAVSASLPELSYTKEQKNVLDGDLLAHDITELFDKGYKAKEEEIGIDRMREIERMILLRIVDNKWMDHIDAMDQLKTGIGLRALGQQDPAAAYTNEGFEMFELMIKSISDEMVHFCFNVTVQTQAQRREILGSGMTRKDEAISALEDVKRQDVAGGSPVYTTGGGLHGAQVPSAAPVANPTSHAKPLPVTVDKRPGRNDPCPCGSGKKYKNCCGRN